MLETNLSMLFTLEAAAEQPAAEISVPAARRTARIRCYWHRTLVMATPVMAAAAVVAIVAGATLLTSGPAPRLRKTGPAAPTSAGFDPMRVYASFGWLPAGTSLAIGETSRTEDALVTEGTLNLSLLIHQPGRCLLQHVSASLQRTELHCMNNSPDGGNALVTGRAPDIGGHPAYWAISGGEPLLIWTYSVRGWAELSYFSCPPSRLSALCNRQAEVVEVARHATVGHPAGSIVFQAVLTRVPKDWQVATAFFTVQDGHLLAYNLQVTAGPKAMAPLGRQPANTPSLSITPLSTAKAARLPFLPPESVCNGYDSFPGDRHPRIEVINGYRVLTGYIRSTHSLTYQACAPDADGLVVFVTQIGAHPKLSVSAIFSRLRFLGTDPADWTTNPVG
jgi:hypothetical protein